MLVYGSSDTPDGPSTSSSGSALPRYATPRSRPKRSGFFGTATRRRRVNAADEPAGTARARRTRSAVHPTRCAATCPPRATVTRAHGFEHEPYPFGHTRTQTLDRERGESFANEMRSVPLNTCAEAFQ